MSDVSMNKYAWRLIPTNKITLNLYFSCQMGNH